MVVCRFVHYFNVSTPLPETFDENPSIRTLPRRISEPFLSWGGAFGFLRRTDLSGCLYDVKMIIWY